MDNELETGLIATIEPTLEPDVFQYAKSSPKSVWRKIDTDIIHEINNGAQVGYDMRLNYIGDNLEPNAFELTYTVTDQRKETKDIQRLIVKRG